MIGRIVGINYRTLEPELLLTLSWAPYHRQITTIERDIVGVACLDHKYAWNWNLGLLSSTMVGISLVLSTSLLGFKRHNLRVISVNVWAERKEPPNFFRFKMFDLGPSLLTLETHPPCPPCPQTGRRLNLWRKENWRRSNSGDLPNFLALKLETIYKQGGVAVN